jgi:nucleoside-diphosphate-sugar epimerase
VKVLVTGAAGFLGGHLVDMLLERGDEVRAMVRPVEDASRLRKLDGVEVVLGDLVDRESLNKVVQGVKRVYNVAAKTGPWGLEKDYNAVNVWGVADLITASMDAGVQRVVHTSSITVYGHHLQGIITEDHPFHAEDNPYSRTKIACEKLIADFVTERGAPVVIVRPAWIYGPRDTTSFGRFVAMVESEKGFLIGSGKNIVPVVYVRDVAQGLIKAGDSGDEVIGKAYTIADDRRVTQAVYLNMIADFLEVPPVTRNIPYFVLFTAGRSAELVWQAIGRRKSAPPPVTTYGVTLLGGNQEFSIEKARRELGYEPEYDVIRGVFEGVNWYLHARKRSNGAQKERKIVSAKPQHSVSNRLNYLDELTLPEL